MGKSLGLQGFVDVLVAYRLLPDWSFWTLASGVTGSEWALAVWILVGWQLPTGTILAMAMNGLYPLGLIITLVRSLDFPNLDATASFSHNRCSGIPRSKIWP